MSLTQEQIQAIEINGKNVIVSAGAGSGKTRVLSERVFDRVSNKQYKWNIDEMLVLTFTNAAASNMKTRIRNKIAVNENNELTQQEKQIQLNKIDSSFIMTFDAYAQFLAKKYHQELGIDKNIKIIDSNIIKNKTQEIINELMIEEYEKGNKEFLTLINNFCVKDDNNIKEKIIYINNKLNTIYRRSDYTRNYESNFYSDEAINRNIEEYVNIIKNKISVIDELLNKLSEEVENYKEYFVGIDALLNSKTYEEIQNNCDVDCSKRMMNKGELAKQLKASISEIIKEIKDMCLFEKKEIKQQVLNTKNNTLYLIKLADELNSRLFEYKKRINMYEFSDVFNMVNELVENNKEIREEITNSFKEILIDEYQDTNNLQDEFIKKISNNNIYMVGDIKQSIYRFRNANPQIFKDKYEAYKKQKDGDAIKLSSNFRSRNDVLDGINTIFDRIMDSKIGGADYIDDHHMIAGNENYENIGKVEGQSNKTEILSYEYNSENKNSFPFDKLDKSEVEAFIIAKDIEDKINSGYRVTDVQTTIDENGNKKQVMITRPVEYKDFTILVDRGTNFETLKQILMSRNIPSDIQAEEKMDESDLLTVVRAIFKLLTCISNDDYTYNFEYSYMSLARSYLVEMADSELYEIITNNSYKETNLYKKVLKIYEDIETKTINNILDEFIQEFDIYSKLSKIGDIDENLIKIDYLYQLGNSLNEAGMTYKDFNDYLVNIFDNDKDTIKFKIQKDNRNAVVITNIHQSKGLEYSICYYPFLTVGFNKQDVNESIVFSDNHGLVIPTYIENKGLKQTIIKDIYKNKYNLQDISERIRLFYVALTRAKEKMILVCPLEDKTEEGRIISDESRLKINCYADMLSMIYSDLSTYIKDINFEDYKDVINTNYQLTSRNIYSQIPQINEKIEVKKQILIKPEIINKDGYSKKAGLISEEVIQKMDLGTRIHYYLETLDFINPNYALIESQYIDLIKAFLDSDLMVNKNSASIHKEYEFIYKQDNESKHGFIDLLMEYEDHFDIIDYKTKYIYDEHYDEQLNGYRKYIETITNKKVNCYLYSVMDKTYREVLI